MIRRSFVLCACVFLAPLARAMAPLEAYGNLPSIEDLALSPDGSKLAFVRTDGDWRAIEILEADGAHKPLAALRVSRVKLRRIEWGDNNHLLLTTATSGTPIGLVGERQEWNLMQVYDLQSLKIRPLLQHVTGLRGNVRVMNVVFGLPVIHAAVDGTVIYLHGIYLQGVTQPALFSVNLTTGVEQLVRTGTTATVQWMVDDDGEVVAEQDYFEASRSWQIRIMRGGHATQAVGGVAPIDIPAMLGLSADGAAIVTGFTESDQTTLRTLVLKDATWGAGVRASESINDVVRGLGSNRLLGTAFLDDTAAYHFDDKALQENWDWAVRRFGGDRVELISLTADHSLALVKVFGPTFGYSYHLVHLGERFSEAVGAIYMGVPTIAEVRRIEYPAADGLRIPAYLTLPPGHPPAGLPVIVMPHGGPQARDRLDFDWWAQALASRGYAVLQPNFRGSALTEEWLERGYGEWGRKMQSDLSDGLSYLVQQGLVDAKRACIV